MSTCARSILAQGGHHMPASADDVEYTRNDTHMLAIAHTVQT